MDKLFYVAWHLKGHGFIKKIRDVALHFKKDMMQLFWIMKEYNQSTKKILVAFAKLFHYTNDKTYKVEGIEVEVEVEVGKVEGKWRTEDCYQHNL
jgi:hypothetical protein